MKKHIYTMIAMIVLVGSMAVAAQGQTGPTRLRADIPFAFNVGNTTLPAGEYLVRAIGNDTSNVVILIQSADGDSHALSNMSMVRGKAQDSARLVFRRYGNKYFFAEAWIDGQTDGLGVPKSRAERAAQKELASLAARTETVALRIR